MGPSRLDHGVSMTGIKRREAPKQDKTRILEGAEREGKNEIPGCVQGNERNMTCQLFCKCFVDLSECLLTGKKTGVSRFSF